MEHQTNTTLRIGAWCVNPASGQISRDGEACRVEVRTIRLLMCLAEHAGEVVSIDDLLTHVWSGIVVAPDSVYQAVASLRRLLGDDPKQPTYIATVPRLGYRMVATVSPWADQSVTKTVASRASDSKYPTPGTAAAPDELKKSGARLRSGFTWAAGGGLCLALIVAFLLYGAFLFRGKVTNNHFASAAVAPQPQKSIAVLPFLDLTEEMNQESFADGMTEELIDKLSRIPGLRVPPPPRRSYLKGKHCPLCLGLPKPTTAELPRTRGSPRCCVAMLRKSDAGQRFASRLILEAS